MGTRFGCGFKTRELHRIWSRIDLDAQEGWEGPLLVDEIEMAWEVGKEEGVLAGGGRELNTSSGGMFSPNLLFTFFIFLRFSSLPFCSRASSGVMLSLFENIVESGVSGSRIEPSDNDLE